MTKEEILEQAATASRAAFARVIKKHGERGIRVIACVTGAEMMAANLGLTPEEFQTVALELQLSYDGFQATEKKS